MKVIHAASELGAGTRRVCLAIGFFDGVHLGHQQVIRQTIADARQHDAVALVLTFDRHPSTVVAPAHAPALIYSLEQKLRVLDSLGPDALLVIPFDPAFSQRTGEEFIRDLARDLGQIQSICVGANFVFGHRRSGTIQLLKKLGTELKFNLHGLAAVSLDGKAVSSTRIRQTIQAGALDDAGQMLGRAYSLAGKVIRGDELGRQLGFPTANLDTTGLVLPPNGVYMAQAIAGGKPHRAVLNIGRRPTLGNPTAPPRVEAHLLDFTGDLYGQDLEIVFVQKLRDEKKFESLEDLRRQISLDIQEANEKL